MERVCALNPNAQPWEPKLEKGTEDDRTIYITFSRGHPLTSQQIRNFFTGAFGDCIEKIYLHQPYRWRAPLFGKVVFNRRSIPGIILGDQDQMHFKIGNKSLWCKRYKNREIRNA